MNKKSNWQEFKNIIEEKGIKKLYHFTDRDNLESIIKTVDFIHGQTVMKKVYLFSNQEVVICLDHLTQETDCSIM